MPARFGSIRVRLLVLLLFLGLAPLLLAGGLAEVFGTRYLASAVGTELERVARVLAVSLDRRVETTRQVVESWAAFPDVRRAVRDGRTPGATVAGQPASVLLADVRGVIADLAEILLVDRDGRLVGASGTPEAESFAEAPWFYQTFGAGCGAVTFDELSWSARAADNVTAINVPVCDGQRVTGVLRAILSLGGVLGLAADLEIGDEVEIRIIRSDGEPLAAVHGRRARPERSEGAAPVRDLARLLVGSAAGHREASLGGPPAVVGYAASVGSGRFKGLGWVVLVAEPLSIAHRPVSFFQRGLLLLAALVLLAVVVVGARAARALTGPLERSAAVARAIAGGSLSQRLQPSGQEELDSLAESLNHMTSNLGEMVGSVRLAAHEVEGVSRQIAGGSERVVSGSRDQIERVGQTNALLRDADDAVQQVGVSLADMATCTDDAAASILEMEASIAEIGGSTEALSSTTASALGAVEQMVASIREVDAALDQLRELAGGTATAVRESDAALRQVEGLASRTAEASEQVTADAELGRESVRRTVDGMGGIESAALRTAAAISALTEEVGKIGGITGIIDDVTEQTNLLALNAAILSAQAGEHGRGFSVVAQEIKALAERTARSTQEIAALVRSIQEGAAGAARAVEAGVAHVRDGVALSRQAGGALDQILAGARASSDMVRGIAAAAGEHAERSHQITVAIQRLHETVGRIATTTQQQTQGCTALVQDGQRIRDMTERVRRAIQEQGQGSRRISTSMQRMTSMARGIEGAAQRQRALSRSLVEAMASIESLSRDNVATIAEVDAAIGSLTERAAGLRSRIARFRDTA